MMKWVRAGQEPRKIVKAGWAAGETTGAKAMCLEWTQCAWECHVRLQCIL